MSGSEVLISQRQPIWNCSAMAVSSFMAQCFVSLGRYCLGRIICLLCVLRKMGKCQIYHGAQCVSTWKVNAQSLSAIRPFFEGVDRHSVPTGIRWVLLCSNKYFKWCSGSDQIQPAFSEKVEVEKKQPYSLFCCLNNLLPEAVPFNRIF